MIKYKYTAFCIVAILLSILAFFKSQDTFSLKSIGLCFCIMIITIGIDILDANEVDDE